MGGLGGASCPRGGCKAHDLSKVGTQGGGRNLDTYRPAAISTGLGEPPQNPRQECEKVIKKVSPNVMRMKQIFENKNMTEKVESQETEKESRVKQLSNTFENMMDREKRKTNERVEKQREADKRDRKNKRELIVKRNRVISEKTENRVFSRVEGIERQVVKQKGGGTAEKKMKMN